VGSTISPRKAGRKSIGENKAYHLLTFESSGRIGNEAALIKSCQPLDKREKTLKVVTISAVAFALTLPFVGQVSTTKGETAWKEYVYPDDNFAITLPTEPVPHKDAQLPNLPITVYTSGGVSLRVENASGGCDFAITEQLKMIDEVKAGQRKPDPTFRLDLQSVRQGTLEGYAFLEFEQTVRDTTDSYERWYCADQKLYMFSAQWPVGHSRPASVNRIVASFRLLKKK
jgi:hypothetical protein